MIYSRNGFSIIIDNSRDKLLTQFAKDTLKDRYLLEGETPQTMFARAATSFSSNLEMAQRMYDYISKLWFMPSTPVLSNGGTDRGLPISCFLNNVSDSLSSISEKFNENLWLAARGGGIGTNWSDVRPINEKIGRAGKTSGVIPFMHIQDSMTLGISQGSLRRGSAAAYLDISHPEIEEFVEMRRPTGGDPNRKNLNLHHGINVSDAFMQAVEQGRDWRLVSPTTNDVCKIIKARDLWERILTARIETGEPYLLFIDTVNKHRPEHHKDLGLFVKQSNLCSEITLPTGEDYMGKDRTAVCCLGSLNLEKWDEYNNKTKVFEDVMLFLDNILEDFIQSTEEVEGFQAARYSAMSERSVGLGVMGFHSLLQKMNVPFESAMAKVVNKSIFSKLKRILTDINYDLAQKLGPCLDSQCAGGDLVRFSNMTAIAPTASISTICGGVSPGIEAFAGNAFRQDTLSGSFEVRNKHLDALIREEAERRYPVTETVNPETLVQLEEFVEEQWSNIITNEGSVQHLNYLSKEQKDVFKTAFEIDQRFVVEFAADRTPFIDQSQSLNLFLNPDAHKRDLHFLHFNGWKSGVKSFYYLRSKSKQRAGKLNHMVGELPTARDPKTVTMVDYDECLACT